MTPPLLNHGPECQGVVTAPLSSPPAAPRPPAGGDPDALMRGQILVDTACAFARSTGPAVDVLRAMLRRRSVLDREAVALLLLAAYRDAERLALLCEDVHDAQWDMERHAETDYSHQYCCEGSCSCQEFPLGRCDRCDAMPVERLDDAVRALRGWLAGLFGERAVVELCGAA